MLSLRAGATRDRLNQLPLVFGTARSEPTKIENTPSPTHSGVQR